MGLIFIEITSIGKKCISNLLQYFTAGHFTIYFYIYSVMKKLAEKIVVKNTMECWKLFNAQSSNI